MSDLKQNEMSHDDYKRFYDVHSVTLLQYASLRENFNKLVDDVLGEDYYNMGMDVYECDRIACEDIKNKANLTISKEYSAYGLKYS